MGLESYITYKGGQINPGLKGIGTDPESKGGENLSEVKPFDINFISNSLDTLNSLVGPTDAMSQQQNQIKNLGYSALSTFGGPVGMVAATGLKAIDFGKNALGINADNISHSAAKKIQGTDVWARVNNIANILPISVGGKKLSEVDNASAMNEYMSSFGNVASDLGTAQEIAGKRLNLWTPKQMWDKYNDFVKNTNEMIYKVSTLGAESNLRKQGAASMANLQNIINQNTYAKQGTKLLDKEFILKMREFAKKKSEEIPEFKDGGVIGIDSNIIPEGALHRELNHMDKVNEEIDEVITDKGIAVVVVDKEGEIQQVAEIEREEIIYSLSTTQKIEEAWKKWKESDDEDEKTKILIEIGKFITKETLHNTDDLTDLIEKID